MSNFVDRIKIVFDVDNASAGRNIKSLRAEIAGTEGPLNKMKVAGKGAFDMLGTYGPQAAMAAGTALVGFAASSVRSFEQTTLAIGKFRDATGFAAEDASRLKEVAESAGVGLDTVSAAARKVNVEAEKGTLGKYGVDIAKTASGAYDASGTFLNVVEAISKVTDASKREEMARRLLGKSWAELSPILKDLRKNMAAVSDEQVFNDEDIARGRDLQAAFDNLGDSVEKIKTSLARSLAPSVSESSSALADMIDLLGSADRKLYGTLFGGGLSGLASDLKPAHDAYQNIADAAVAAAQGAADAADAADASVADQNKLTAALDDQRKATEDLLDAQNALIGRDLDQIEARRRAEQSAADYNAALVELGGAALAAGEADAALAAAQADSKTSAEDLKAAQDAAAEAHRAVATAEQDAADKARALAEDNATAKDSSDNAAAAVRSQITDLEAMIATLAPGSPLRNNLQAYVNQLKSIPTSINTHVTVTSDGYQYTQDGAVIRRSPSAGPGGGSGGTVLGSSVLFDALQSGGTGGSSKPNATPMDRGPDKAARIAKARHDLEIIRNKYKAGKVPAGEYRMAIKALQGLLEPWSNEWVSLAEEYQSTATEGGALNIPKHTQPGPSSPATGSPTGPKSRSGAVAGVQVAGSASGAFVLEQHNHFPNAVVVDERGLRKAMDLAAPHIERALRRLKAGRR